MGDFFSPGTLRYRMTLSVKIPQDLKERHTRLIQVFPAHWGLAPATWMENPFFASQTTYLRRCVSHSCQAFLGTGVGARTWVCVCSHGRAYCSSSTSSSISYSHPPLFTKSASPFPDVRPAWTPFTFYSVLLSLCRSCIRMLCWTILSSCWAFAFPSEPDRLFLGGMSCPSSGFPHSLSKALSTALRLYETSWVWESKKRWIGPMCSFKK